MPRRKRHYVLTQKAMLDFRQAKIWSISRWGKDLTTQYFNDLHQGAEFIALNLPSLPEKEYMTGMVELGVYAVREHYIIHVPISKKRIAIVALIRQTRDVPAIIKANNYIIRRELRKILSKISEASGEGV